MIKEILLGKIGLTMESGIIVNWLKREGDYIEKGEPFFEVETDKATQVIGSYHSGYIKKILVREGQEVPVRTVIAYIGEKDDKVPEDYSDKGMLGTFSRAETIPGIKSTGERSTGRIDASPLAKRLAGELGVDLSRVIGTGSGGRIGKEDVLAAKAEKEKIISGVALESPIRVASQKKLMGIKKVVAERMKASYAEAPHIHLEIFVDMTCAFHVRNQVDEESRGKIHLTFTDILAFAVARTLRKNLYLNATLRDDVIVVFDEINIGIAVATEKGLVVPVIKNADRLTLTDLSTCRTELVERANSNRQTSEDLAGGTFTITNLGMYGIVSFKPIINTGQAGTLAMGKIINMPVTDESMNVSVKPLMNLSLACDHRIVDGVDGANFLSSLKKLLESQAEITRWI